MSVSIDVDLCVKWLENSLDFYRDCTSHIYPPINNNFNMVAERG